MAEKDKCSLDDCIQDAVLKDLKLCMEQHNERFHQGDLQFQAVKADMRAILDGQVGIKEEQAKTNKRLFVDNGTISMQTRQDRHTQMLKNMMWAITSISLVVTSVIVRLIITAILHGNGVK